MAITPEAIDFARKQPERKAKLDPEKIKKFKARHKSKPEENLKNKKKSPYRSELTYEDFYNLAGVTQHSQFENFLKEIIFQPERRNKFYDSILELSPYLERDSFRSYFEIYSAERKTNMQDYTPDEVTGLMAKIARSDAETYKTAGYSAYDATAGTGSMIIAKWNDDRIQESPWSYAPHRYLYRADELADNSIPYLIHNLAIRGMNAIVVHGDTLTGKTNQIYFIQNSKDDYMAYSDVNVMPHSDEVAREFGVTEWLQEPIDYIESEKIRFQYALPMKRKALEVSTQPPKYEVVLPWKDAPRMKDIAFVERVQKNKIYPKDTILIQISATRGQLGMLESDGLVESGKYVAVVVRWGVPIEPRYLYYWLGSSNGIPRYFHAVQEGLNVPIEHIENMPVFVPYTKELKEIQYGQLSLF